MSATVRVLLIWLVVAALPFKAVAAVAMIACGPGHQAITAHAAQADPTAHAAHGAHHGHHAADSDSAGDRGAPASDGTAHGAKLKCSSCAPCCGATAPASDGVRLPVRPPATGLAATERPPRAGVVEDVPHRPPRSAASC